MNEKHSRETADAAEVLWTELGKPAWKLHVIAEVIQAAEERGRRRGVEEERKQEGCRHGDKAHPCALPRVEQLEELLRDAGRWVPRGELRDDIDAALSREARAALAPRDSECTAICRTLHICKHGREYLPKVSLGMGAMSDERYEAKTPFERHLAERVEFLIELVTSLHLKAGESTQIEKPRDSGKEGQR